METGLSQSPKYNDHDYQKLVAFLNQTDRRGVSNGDKLSDNYNYNPNDPATWGTYDGHPRFEWVELGGELRIQSMYVSEHGLCGTLDVSDCIALAYLDCFGNNLTELNVRGCTALEHLECFGNYLTTLDVSNNTALECLGCCINNLTSLDVSNNTALKELRCYNNNLTTVIAPTHTIVYCDYGVEVTRTSKKRSLWRLLGLKGK